MNVTGKKLQSLYAPVGNHWHESTIERHSLSHALAGVPAPSEREPGSGWCHSSGYSLKSQVTGDFHRPYETQNILHSTIYVTEKEKRT